MCACEWTYSYIDCCISQSSRKLMFKIFFWNYYDKDLISKTKIVSEYLNFFNFKEEIQSHAGLDKYMYDLHSLQHCCRRFICKFYSYCIKFWFLISLNIEPKSITNLAVNLNYHNKFCNIWFQKRITKNKLEQGKKYPKIL